MLARALAGSLLLVSCSSAPSKPEPDVAGGESAAHHHPILAPSCIVDIAPGRPGIETEEAGSVSSSAPTLSSATPPITRVPSGATVFFRNSQPSHFVELRVDGDFETCAPCVTVTNFTCLKHGALAAAIEPGGVSTLCFHKPGRYTFRATGGPRPLVGAIEVFTP